MRLQQLISGIDARIENGNAVIVSIDGMAAAGKTTLAAKLADYYSCNCCNVIQMDHFFLRPEQRTPERLAQPGGNIDYERFNTEVAKPLKSGKIFSYRPFDCEALKLADSIEIVPKQLTVVEGVYSFVCMSSLEHIKVFLRIDKDEQHSRLLKRDPDLYERFLSEWLPMENKYFEHFSVQEKCDYLFG